MDLFEPGSGSQVHDNNGGVLASGLFWTLPADELRVSEDGRRAVLHIENIGVIDSFQIPEIPASFLELMGLGNGVYLASKFIPIPNEKPATRPGSQSAG